MEIKISNCNNIDNGTTQIVENRLNIKYALNGTGKSTIASAISAALDAREGSGSLSHLTPFKAPEGEDLTPKVEGLDDVRSMKVFHEDYVNDFVFLPDELLKGSFDVFVRDEEYELGMNEIEELVSELKSVLEQDQDIAELIQDFAELSTSFGRPTQKGLHGSSQISKAFKNGNKVTNIPPGLEVYRDYIQNEQNYKWIKWQIDGKEFIDVSDNCPYCVSGIADKKSTIRRVSEVYEPKIIENLNKIIAVFQRLNKYFADDTRKIIEDFVGNVDGYTDEQVAFLREIKDQIDRLKAKFVRAQQIGFVSLKDVDKLIESLKDYKIDGKLYNHLGSDTTFEKIAIVNEQIDNLLDKAGKLQGSINKQKAHVEHVVKENSSEINMFLRSAGFPYTVDLVENESGEYRLKLNHEGQGIEVAEPKTHLSFGERNAFAVVLFMYDALKAAPDLIILDDPISSFDKNKKYAMIDMLFRRTRCLRGKTVLMLTHDFEPIVDMLLHHSDRFEVPSASFLENVHGELKEKAIKKDDIRTFIDINKRNVNRDIHPLSKLVYLRRYYEITDDRGMAYHLISSILHRRGEPTLGIGAGARKMTQDEKRSAIEEIKKHLPDFDYDKLVSVVADDAQLLEIYRNSKNNYEKLHIYRIIFQNVIATSESDVIRKFINQTFHTETDYIYQLDPSDYQTIPQYVIDECDSSVRSHFG